MTPAERHAYDAGRFTELVRSAAPADWTRPSPVRDWKARDVVHHLVEWLPGLLGPSGVELSPVDVDADPLAAWRARAAEVQEVLEQQGDRTFTSEMLGELKVVEAIDRFYTADVWMHSWDLARALDRDFDLGEDRAAAALAGMEPIDDLLRSSGQFGPRVAVSADAPAQDRLIAFIGRDPAWHP